MSRTFAHRDQRDTVIAPEQRGRRVGRPPVRRTGTRSAVIAAALAELNALTADDVLAAS